MWLGLVVAALWAAAGVAWVNVWPAVAGDQTQPAHRYAPPRVVVDANVTGIDQGEVAMWVDQVVNDPRGWRTDFDRYVLRIVQPGYRGTYGIGQDIGRAFISEGYVVVTADAWMRVGPRFEAVGGTLGQQRTFVILHELGHLLDHPGHDACPGPGQPAPVMRAATFALDGCTLNVWPHPEAV